MSWSKQSWREKPIHQDVNYPDVEKLTNALKKLEHLPPLVTPTEIHKLREKLRDAALGKAFLLQGGDCAELFDYCSKEPIESKLKVILQMSLILVWGARIPVVRIARTAGQYGKPRSKPTEMFQGAEIPSYRGDNINGYDPNDRIPDPQRLVSAYFHSAATLNYLRAILGSGFADLHHLSDWDLQHVRSGPLREEYQTIANRLTDSLDFMRVVEADKDNASLHTVDFFTSHEAMHLPYEESLTRSFPASTFTANKAAHWDTSAHFLWIGDRTRQLDGAHVEFLRGVENPIGVKVGPSMQPEELPQLLNLLNPNKEIGKITLITRYGAEKILSHLPEHIKAVKASGHVVVWCCDPMHGNTESTSLGVKTRNFENILTELGHAFRIHQQHQSRLNGVHFELTGDRVTECVGGSMQLDSSDLATNYQTHCDPRLNYEQSMDMAFLIAKYYEKERRGMGMFGL